MSQIDQAQGAIKTSEISTDDAQALLATATREDLMTVINQLRKVATDTLRRSGGAFLLTSHNVPSANPGFIAWSGSQINFVVNTDIRFKFIQNESGQVVDLIATYGAVNGLTAFNSLPLANGEILYVELDRSLIPDSGTLTLQNAVSGGSLVAGKTIKKATAAPALVSAMSGVTGTICIPLAMNIDSHLWWIPHGIYWPPGVSSPLGAVITSTSIPIGSIVPFHTFGDNQAYGYNSLKTIAPGFQLCDGSVIVDAQSPKANPTRDTNGEPTLSYNAALDYFTPNLNGDPVAWSGASSWTAGDYVMNSGTRQVAVQTVPIGIPSTNTQKSDKIAVVNVLGAHTYNGTLSGTNLLGVPTTDNWSYISPANVAQVDRLTINTAQNSFTYAGSIVKGVNTYNWTYTSPAGVAQVDRIVVNTAPNNFTYSGSIVKGVNTYNWTYTSPGAGNTTSTIATGIRNAIAAAASVVVNATVSLNTVSITAVTVGEAGAFTGSLTAGGASATYTANFTPASPTTVSIATDVAAAIAAAAGAAVTASALSNVITITATTAGAAGIFSGSITAGGAFVTYTSNFTPASPTANSIATAIAAAINGSFSARYTASAASNEVTVTGLGTYWYGQTFSNTTSNINLSITPVTAAGPIYWVPDTVYNNTSNTNVYNKYRKTTTNQGINTYLRGNNTTLAASNASAYSGANTHQLAVAELPAHSHTMQPAGAQPAGTSGSAGSHNHGGSTDPTGIDRYTASASGAGFESGDDRGAITGIPYTTSAHTHTIPTQPDHTHTIPAIPSHFHTIDVSGGSGSSLGNAHNNEPRYHNILYIVRIY